jgi:hypothetical protein
MLLTSRLFDSGRWHLADVLDICEASRLGTGK